jgi:type IV pilus assembly protein PilW
MFRIAKTKAGFSLVELMVAMAVSGIVLTSIYQVYNTQLKTYTTQQSIVEMQQNMRAILYLMEREIRMAGYAPEGGLGGAGNPIFSIARVNDLQYNIDITGGQSDGADNDDDGDVDEPDESVFSDGDSDDAGEIVRYQMSGGQLLRNGEMVADNIDSLAITYLDAAGAALAFDSGGDLVVPQNIRSIVVTLSGTPRSPGAVRKQMSLSSEIRIRNMYGPMI